jgi:hypothetical protein
LSKDGCDADAMAKHGLDTAGMVTNDETVFSGCSRKTPICVTSSP